MWRTWFWKALDPPLLALGRALRRADTRKRDERARRAATLDATVVIGPYGSITNFLGDPTAIRIGAHTYLNGDLETLWDAGRIVIGERCRLDDKCRLMSHASIHVGDDVVISPLVDILDTDGHPLKLDEWRRDVQAILSWRLTDRVPEKILSKPVSIGDHAWIGPKATILKGVRIGRHAIVTPGTVVVRDVPDYAIASGNPAAVIGQQAIADPSQ